MQMSFDEARETLITFKRQKFDKLIFCGSVDMEGIVFHELPGFIDAFYVCHDHTADSRVLRTGTDKLRFFVNSSRNCRCSASRASTISSGFTYLPKMITMAFLPLH